MVGHCGVELGDQIGREGQDLLPSEGRDDLLRGSVEGVEAAQRLLRAEPLGKRAVLRHAQRRTVHVVPDVPQRGAAVLRREDQAGQTDARPAGAVPGGQEGVRPGTLHLVGGCVVAVGGPVEQQVGSAARRVDRSAPAEHALPDPVGEIAGRGLDAEAGSADLLVAEGPPQDVQVLAGQFALAGRVPPEGGVLQVAGAAAHAEFHPPAAERVDGRDVLGEADRVLQREHRDRRAEPDPGGARGGVREEGPRGGQSAAAERNVVLGHPADVEAEFVGDHEQVLGVAVGAGEVGAAPLDVGEEAEPETGSLAGHARPLSRSRDGAGGCAGWPGPAGPDCRAACRPRTRCGTGPASAGSAPRRRRRGPVPPGCGRRG